MIDISRLGGGYAESRADPAPTAAALLEAARPGAPGARLIVLGGPPGVGKSAVAARLLALLPNSFLLDKDATAAGFVLQAARAAGLPESQAYGSASYWRELRPLEYAGPLALACANLVGTRRVLLVGGWGPELTLPHLWSGLAARLDPSPLHAFHLEAPPLEVWRARLAARGSRFEPAAFEAFARALTSWPVWEGTHRISTHRPLPAIVQSILDLLPA